MSHFHSFDSRRFRGGMKVCWGLDLLAVMRRGIIGLR